MEREMASSAPPLQRVTRTEIQMQQQQQSETAVPPKDEEPNSKS
jgi:hypothetical protein